MAIARHLNLKPLLEQKSVLLIGPRQSGKTFYLKEEFPKALFIQLLKSDDYRSLCAKPERLRQIIAQQKQSTIIIDEIQRVPELLNEVHHLIETHKELRFILTGSSVRKLHKDPKINLLGGRLRRCSMHPFTMFELGQKFNLSKALLYGTLPSIWFSDQPELDLTQYIEDYLELEVAKEAQVRRLSAFSRFLEVAALSSGQLVEFTNLANDSQVPRTTVHEYYQILLDTLLTYEIPALTRLKSRKLTSTSKFYFFDQGIIHKMNRIREVPSKSPLFGQAFEHLICNELVAYQSFKSSQVTLQHYRSLQKEEVDFVLNEEVGIEVKAKNLIHSSDTRTLQKLVEEKSFKKGYLVTLESRSYQIHKSLEVLSLKDFVHKLWNHELL